MKTKSHTIELADFQHWLEEESMTFASSTRERIRINIIKLITNGKENSKV